MQTSIAISIVIVLHQLFWLMLSNLALRTARALPDDTVAQRWHRLALEDRAVAFQLFAWIAFPTAVALVLVGGPMFAPQL